MHPRSLRPVVLAFAVATLGAGALTGCGSPANDDAKPSAKPTTTLDTDHTVNGGNANGGTKKG